MDLLTLEPATRFGASDAGATKREVVYLQFVMNGEPLDRIVAADGYATDYATALQPDSGKWGAAYLLMLLGEASGDLPSGRVPLLLCAECGDIGCGAIGAFLEVGPRVVTWSGFAYENNYDESFTTEHEAGPFQFDRDSYLRLIEAAPACWPGS